METDRKSTAALVAVTILFFGGFVLFVLLFATQTKGAGMYFGAGTIMLVAAAAFGGLATWFALRNISDIVIDARQLEKPRAANEG